MPDEECPAGIAGAAELSEWFGRWPCFHDAEIVSLELNRAGESLLKVCKFYAGPEPGHSSNSIDTQNAIVTFGMKEITGMELYDFNHQNVISGLSSEQADDGYKIDLEGCYGLQGHIIAKRIRVSIEPAVEGK
jgi:Immunity protein 50